MNVGDLEYDESNCECSSADSGWRRVSIRWKRNKSRENLNWIERNKNQAEREREKRELQDMAIDAKIVGFAHG